MRLALGWGVPRGNSLSRLPPSIKRTHTSNLSMARLEGPVWLASAGCTRAARGETSDSGPLSRRAPFTRASWRPLRSSAGHLREGTTPDFHLGHRHCRPISGYASRQSRTGSDLTARPSQTIQIVKRSVCQPTRTGLSVCSTLAGPGQTKSPVRHGLPGFGSAPIYGCELLPGRPCDLPMTDRLGGVATAIRKHGITPTAQRGNRCDAHGQMTPLEAFGCSWHGGG